MRRNDMTPGFKSHLRVAASGDRVYFLGERESFILKNPLCRRIAPLLDGTRTLEDIIAIVTAGDGEISPAHVHFIVDELVERGYVARRPSSGPEAVFWSGQGLDPRAARHHTLGASCHIDLASSTRHPGIAPDRLARALEGAGLSVTGEQPSPSAIRVVLTDDYLDPGLDGFNRRAAAAGWTWLPIKPVGVAPWFGPLFTADGPCWQCLAERLDENRSVEAYLRRAGAERETLRPPQGHIAAAGAAAMELAATALARWVAAGGSGWLGHTLVAVELDEMRIARHPVLRLPHCAVCGDGRSGPPDAREQPIELQSRPLRGDAEGGRMASIDDTRRRLRRYVSPLTGLISLVQPSPGRDDSTVPVFMAVQPARPVRSDPTGTDFVRASWGKGTTARAAEVGALCEALERRAATFRGDEPRLEARLAELGDAAPPPESYLLFSTEQYRRREQLNAAITRPVRRIPLPFDRASAVEWTPAWSLTRDAVRYLPMSYCYLDYPAPPGREFAHFSSNGHACGSCREEAVLHGLLELCERDAVAIWWYNRCERPALALESLPGGFALGQRERYRRLGWELWLLDITTDLGVPTFVAVAAERDHGDRLSRVFVGFGCHLAAAVAARNALTELGQLFYPASSRETRTGSSRCRVDLREHSYLCPGGAVSSRADGFVSPPADDLRDVLRGLLGRLEEMGMEVIVLDQSRRDIDLSIVKVVVPGLRHFWPRLAPGRLYTVPKTLGWLDRPRDESELNPLPIFW